MSGQAIGRNNIKKLAALGFLSALIIILQFASSFLVKLGVFSISLVLIPITVGAVLYGIRAGAFLGGVFGAVCLIAGVSGLDAGTFAMIQYNFWYTALVAVGKGVLAGALSGLLYKIFAEPLKRDIILAFIIASITTPIVNTCMYLLGMVTLFRKYAEDALQVQGAVTVLLALLGIIIINFIIEFILNIVICPIIIKSITKNGKLKRIK